MEEDKKTIMRLAYEVGMNEIINGLASRLPDEIKLSEAYQRAIAETRAAATESLEETASIF